MKKVLFLLLALPAVSMAQTDPSCEAANALFGALLNKRSALDCRKSPASPAQPQASPETGTTSTSELQGGFNRMGRDVNTPENIELLTKRVKERFEAADPLAHPPPEPFQVCREEMAPLSRFENIMGSNHDQVKVKCFAAARDAQAEFSNRRRVAMDQKREEAARADAEKEEKQKRDEAEALRVVVADLRAGRRQPTNCAQWMISKGHEIANIDRDVSRVSLEPPKGVGKFAGVIELIEGRQLIVNNGAAQPSFMVLNVGSSAKIFEGPQVKPNAVVYGYATQTGSRTLKMSNGAAKTAAVLDVACVGPFQ